MIYALITNGVVEDIIILKNEDTSFLSGLCEQIVRIDTLRLKPGIGWFYDGENFSRGESE